MFVIVHLRKNASSFFLTFFKFHSELGAFLDKFLEIIERQPYIILAHPQPNIPITSNFY